MKTILSILIALPLMAQTGNTVRVNDAPSPDAVQKVYVLSGSNTVAICSSPSYWEKRGNTRLTISGVSKANPGIATSVGHGFPISSRPKISISGATGTGWTAINTVLVALIIDADTFSLYTTSGVAVDTSGFGTLGGTVVFTSLAPRLTVPEWAVQTIAYDGSDNAIWSGWLYGSTAYAFKCSEAATAGIQRQ